MCNFERRAVILLMTHASFFLSHRLELARHLSEAGFRVIVAAHEDVRLDRELLGRIEFRQIGFTRQGLDPFRELRVLLQIVRLYRQERPDIAHHFAHKAIIYGGIASAFSNVKAVVGTFTGLGYAFTARSFKAHVVRAFIVAVYFLLLRMAYSAVVFQNPDDRRFFLGRGLIDRRRSAVIYGSGVDCKKFVPTPDPDAEVPRVLVPGRMLWSKGIHEVVQAAKLLRRDNVEVEFVLAGAGGDDNPQGIPIETLVGWSEEGCVRWVGQSQDMPGLIASSTIVCLPSHREGLPLALAEAAASGRAIVTSDAPGCREVVQDGGNGYLVRVGDYEGLARCIRKLLVDRELRRRMGRESRVIAETLFSSERILAEVTALYGRCLQEGSG